MASRAGVEYEGRRFAAMKSKLLWLLFALAVALSGLNYADGQSVTLTAPPQFTSFLQNGTTNAFGCVFTYASGTSTPLTTYTDYTGTTANANPVVLSAGGTANIWFSTGVLYRIVVKTSGGVHCFSGTTIYTADGVNSSLLNTSNVWDQSQYFLLPIYLEPADLQIIFGWPSGTQTTLDIPPTSANYILHGPTITANDTLLSENAVQTVTNKNLTTGIQLNGCGIGAVGGSTSICIANNAITATVLNSLAVLTGAPSTATIAPVAGNSESVVGVVIAGAGITGTATIQQSGEVMCTFDGGTVAGDAVILSPTVAGNCHDAGVTVSAQSIGVVLATNASGGLYSFLLTLTGAGGGGGISGVVDLIANNAVTGTTLNTLTKLTGAPSTAIITATTDTGGFLGVTIGGAGTTGSAVIQKIGIVGCKFDAGTTAGDYVQNSSTVAGNCHDAGASHPVSGQLAGRVLTTNASGGVYAIDLIPSEVHPIATDQHHYLVQLGANVVLSANTPNAILTQAVTMPATGCPCRVITNYMVYIVGNVNGSAYDAWVSDGTVTWGSAQTYMDATGREGGLGGSAFSEATYANSAVVTFTLFVQDQQGNSVFKISNSGAPQSTWMSIDVVSSN